MQAILRYKYQRFCEWIRDMKHKQQLADPKLDELEKDLVNIYFAYVQKFEEIGVIVEAYEEKQKEIRQRIKLRQRKDFVTERSLVPVQNTSI
jgi:hypothetical protein